MNWSSIEPKLIKHALWGTTYTPYTEAKIVYKEKESIIVNMYCEELNPKAIYTKPNEPVYKDSCMECFLNVNPEEIPYYINFEMNSNGAMLIGKGVNRHNRELLDVGFKPTPYKTDKGWGVILEIPYDFLIEQFKDIKDVWKGNFYKCGDKCEYEHFLSWNMITLENPDFHCSEFFGEIKSTPI